MHSSCSPSLSTYQPLAGGVIVVGAPQANNGLGKAYIYELESGNVVFRDTLAGEAEGDEFGVSVAVSENQIVVGASQHGNSGAAYVYLPFDDPNEWDLWKKLSSLDVTGGGDFLNYGYSVSIHLDTIVIGSPGDEQTSGAVIVYRRTDLDWNMFQLLSSDIDFDLYGTAVDVFIDTETGGTTMVIASEGRALVYTDPSREEFLLQDTLASLFGTSVSVYQDTIAVGAPGGTTGNVHFFYRDNDSWKGNIITVPDELEDQSWFGYSVSVVDGRLLVGSPLSDMGGEDSGAAFQYEIHEVCDDTTPSPSRSPISSPSAAPSTAPTFDCDGELIPQPNFVQPVFPGDIQANDTFGALMQVDRENGMYAVISSPDSNDGKGAIYIYKSVQQGWSVLSKFVGETANEGFGSSVAVSDGIVVAGSPNRSRVRIFEVLVNEDIIERTALVGEEELDRFGSSVAVSESQIVVGAPSHGDSGAVYIYEPTDEDEWVVLKKMTPNDEEAGNFQLFGFSLAIQYDTLIIGRKGTQSDSGAAYVYRRSDDNEWTLFQLISSPSPTGIGDDYANAVDLFIDLETTETTILISARGANDLVGQVHVYTDPTRTDFLLQQTLKPSEGTDSKAFGTSVSVYKDTIAVGAPLIGPGSAFFFYRVDYAWTGNAIVFPNVLSEGSFLGASISLVSNEQLLVGVPLSDVTGKDSGVVLQYVVAHVCDE